MIRIALAGNIAGGKSLAQKYIEDLGYKVLDTDCVSHDLLNNNTKILEAFSNYDIKDTFGNISREKLGKLVFSNIELKNQLEKIMHPKIKQKILEFFEQNSKDELLFVGIPLLFEANMTDIFDKIIFVYSDDEIRLKRLIERNNYTKEYAQKRIDNQIPQQEKFDKCDYVINNNGTKEELKLKLNELLKNLRSGK